MKLTILMSTVVFLLIGSVAANPSPTKVDRNGAPDNGPDNNTTTTSGEDNGDGASPTPGPLGGNNNAIDEACTGAGNPTETTPPAANLVNANVGLVNPGVGLVNP
jgi:hypothetical protein